MPSIVKPLVAHPSLAKNELGLTIRDYEGSMSTLCAGCGHDSITAAITRALWELSTPPHRLAKLSGIGCSSKTPTYFVGGAHGFNSAHGRMPSPDTPMYVRSRFAAIAPPAIAGMRPCAELTPCAPPTKYVGVFDEHPMPLSLASLCGSRCI